MVSVVPKTGGGQEKRDYENYVFEDDPLKACIGE
jgi:hypothetical protein